MHNRIVRASMLALFLAACGSGDDTRATADAESAGPALPAPGSDPAGSVTDMPAPGDGEAIVTLGPGDPAGTPAGVATASDDASLAPLANDPLAGDPLAPGPVDPGVLPPAAGAPVIDSGATAGAGATTAAAAGPVEGPGVDGALSTVRGYYSAISAGNYAAAHRLWSGDGSASGQSLEQFASGFADTADVRVHMMEPRTDGGGAAGSQYITVPVTLDTTRRDGSSVQFTGSYTLRRPSDGSGDWRIDSADLREVQR